MKDFNIRHEAIQFLLKKKIGHNLHDMSRQWYFGRFATKNKGNKSKNKSGGLLQAITFLHNEVNHWQNEKAIYWLGKKLFEPETYKVRLELASGDQKTGF